MKYRTLFIGCLLLTLSFSSGYSATPIPDISSLDIEDLMQVQVTTLSRRPESSFDVPAAISVISQEDIRRSGAQTIPDALRLAPGVNVARINGSQWAISIRGFNGRYSNKLLVMIDGRSVYTHQFSGVLWEEQDTLLEDVERIEVIRGPGGTLWGANAVNGIINIITKHTRDTTGSLATLSAGDGQSGALTFRHGGLIGSNGTYRFGGRFASFGALRMVDGSGSGHDGWNLLSGSFRADWEPRQSDSITVEGEIFQNHPELIKSVVVLEPPFVNRSFVTSPQNGNSILARWTRQYQNGSESALQTYYSSAREDNVGAPLFRNSFDVDFQNSLASKNDHLLVWGAGYRRSSDSSSNRDIMNYNPASMRYELFSAFLQDQIDLHHNFKLTIGSKVERNSFSGYEWQPSARIAWKPDEHHLLWASLTRAVRTPSRTDQGFQLPMASFYGANGIPTMIMLMGSPSMRSEELLTQEIGYRWDPGSRFTLDAAAFYNRYRGLRGYIAGTPYMSTSHVPYMVIPYTMGNYENGETIGFECSVRWKPTSRWSLIGNVSLLGDLRLRNTVNGDQLNAPHQQFSLISHLDLPHNLELDATLHAVGRLHDLKVPPYQRLDLRLGWKAAPQMQLELIGQNLLQQNHLEYGAVEGVSPTLEERIWMVKATWKM